MFGKGKGIEVRHLFLLERELNIYKKGFTDSKNLIRLQSEEYETF